MIVRNISLILILWLTALNHAAAGIDAYKCRIYFSSDLQDDGVMRPSDFSKFYVGKEFIVDKETGRISGRISNHNASGQPQVLDYGSNEQAFKALTIYRPRISIDSIYIKEFQDSGEKPFLLMKGSTVYSGICMPL